MSVQLNTVALCACPLSGITLITPEYDTYLVVDNVDLNGEEITWERTQLLVMETLNRLLKSNVRVEKIFTTSFCKLHATIFDGEDDIVFDGPPLTMRPGMSLERWEDKVYSRIYEVDGHARSPLKAARKFLDEIRLSSSQTFSNFVQLIIKDWNTERKAPPSNFIIFTSINTFSTNRAHFSEWIDPAGPYAELRHHARTNLIVQIIVLLNDESELPTFEYLVQNTRPEHRFIRQILPCVIRPYSFAPLRPVT